MFTHVLVYLNCVINRKIKNTVSSMDQELLTVSYVLNLYALFYIIMQVCVGGTTKLLCTCICTYVSYLIAVIRLNSSHCRVCPLIRSITQYNFFFLPSLGVLIKVCVETIWVPNLYGGWAKTLSNIGYNFEGLGSGQYDQDYSYLCLFFF